MDVERPKYVFNEKRVHDIDNNNNDKDEAGINCVHVVAKTELRHVGRNGHRRSMGGFDFIRSDAAEIQDRRRQLKKKQRLQRERA